MKRRPNEEADDGWNLIRDGEHSTGGAVVYVRQPGPSLAWWGPHRQIRGGLFCHGRSLLAIPDLIAVSESRRIYWLASRGPRGHIQLWSYDVSGLKRLRTVQASGIHLGSHWMLTWRGAEASVADLLTGEPVSLPLGAREARARPWPDQPAASWCAGKSLVQQRGSDSPRSVGAATEPLIGLRLGPKGASVAWGREGAWAHAQGHGLVPLSVDLPPSPDCAFSPDGEQALVQTCEGVALVDLRTGEGLDDRPGMLPADWRFYEDPQGRRNRWLDQPDPAPLPRPDRPASPLPPRVQALGLPMDGASPTADGGWLCWQEGGLELELMPGSSTRG